MVDYQEIVARLMERFDPPSVRGFQRALVLAAKHGVKVNVTVLDVLYVAYVFARHFVWDTEFFFSDDTGNGNPEFFVNTTGIWECNFIVHSYVWSALFLVFSENGLISMRLQPSAEARQYIDDPSVVLKTEYFNFSLCDEQWPSKVCTFFNQHICIGHRGPLGNDEPKWVDETDLALRAELMSDVEGMLAYLMGVFIYGVEVDDFDDYMVHSN